MAIPPHIGRRSQSNRYYDKATIDLRTIGVTLNWLMSFAGPGVPTEGNNWRLRQLKNADADALAEYLKRILDLLSDPVFGGDTLHENDGVRRAHRVMWKCVEKAKETLDAFNQQEPNPSFHVDIPEC